MPIVHSPHDSLPTLRRFQRLWDFRPDCYRGPIAQIFLRLAEAVARREMTVDQVLDTLEATFGETDLVAEFAPWIDDWPSGETVGRWLCRRRNRLFSLRGLSLFNLALFYLKPHRSEPPHYHNNTASIQAVVSGRIWCREYERVARKNADILMIRPVSQKLLKVGQAFRMTEHQNNVHWFGAADEAAVVLNCSFGGAALYDKPFEAGAMRPPGRSYLDPTAAPGADGLIAGKSLSAAEAKHRFASRSILSFAWHPSN